MYGVVYKITNTVNGKPYIGQTIQPLDRRVSQHKCADSLIGRAIRKYGRENFTVEILEECETPEQLNEREKFQIAHHNSKAPNGYNRTDGGDGACGYVNSDETRAKKSAARTGKTLSAETRAKIAATNTGKHLSAETRAKMSAKRKGVPKSSEHRAKIGDGNRGKVRTPETRAKIGAAHKGKTISAEQRAMIAERHRGNNHRLGKHHTAEALAKISAATSGEKNPNFGKHMSAESKAKSSASLRGYSPFKNLSAAITGRQLTYKALAPLIGTSPASVSRKMRGICKFTAEEIAKLVEIFGLPVEYLMARDD